MPVSKEVKNAINRLYTSVTFGKVIDPMLKLTVVLLLLMLTASRADEFKTVLCLKGTKAAVSTVTDPRKWSKDDEASLFWSYKYQKSLSIDPFLVATFALSFLLYYLRVEHVRVTKHAFEIMLTKAERDLPDHDSTPKTDDEWFERMHVVLDFVYTHCNQYDMTLVILDLVNVLVSSVLVGRLVSMNVASANILPPNCATADFEVTVISRWVLVSAILCTIVMVLISLATCSFNGSRVAGYNMANIMVDNVMVKRLVSLRMEGPAEEKQTESGTI